MNPGPYRPLGLALGASRRGGPNEPPSAKGVEFYEPPDGRPRARLVRYGPVMKLKTKDKLFNLPMYNRSIPFRVYTVTEAARVGLGSPFGWWASYHNRVVQARKHKRATLYRKCRARDTYRTDLPRSKIRREIRRHATDCC